MLGVQVLVSGVPRNHLAVSEAVTESSQSGGDNHHQETGVYE